MVEISFVSRIHRNELQCKCLGINQADMLGLLTHSNDELIFPDRLCARIAKPELTNELLVKLLLHETTVLARLLLYLRKMPHEAQDSRKENGAARRTVLNKMLSSHSKRAPPNSVCGKTYLSSI